jgi:NAD(P)-dependent dehydrogenase (short-subunit alcohol dehydrogenase family)
MKENSGSNSAYGKKQVVSSADTYAKTLARLQKIQTQLANAPRGTKLKGKVCIITGVGSLKGIGRASAIQFAHESAKHLYLMDFAGDNLPDLKETINKAYPDVKVTVIQADAADEKAISGVCAQALKEEGRLDVFFANAGIAPQRAIPATTDEQFMNTMRVNTLSCFLAIKHASAAMQKVSAENGKEESGGSIVLTASVAGLRSGAGPTDYSASKAAVNSLAKTSIYELRGTNVRVNSICPGLVETGMTSAVFDYAREKGTGGRIGQLNPLGRYGIAEEIAQVATFLASDNSGYINGQNVAVDGGLSASHPVVPGRNM